MSPSPLPSQGGRSHFTRLPGSLLPAWSLALPSLALEKKAWPPSPALPAPLPTWPGKSWEPQNPHGLSRRPSGCGGDGLPWSWVAVRG